MKIITIKERVHSRGFIPLIGACILFLLVILIYRATGQNEFAPELSDKALGGWIAAAALCFVLMIWNNKVLVYAAYLCGLYAWLQFLTSQVNYIANVAVAIDGSSFSFAFAATVLLGLAAWILALIAAVRRPSVFIKENKKQEEEAVS